VLATSRPHGFFAAAKAHTAFEQIGETEQLVTHLGLTGTDLKSSMEALTAAKALYAIREYSRAAAQAERAGALAVSLNERFNAYLAAWKDLRACMAELESLGLPTDTLEAALDSADQEVVHLVPQDGTVVPNYLEATEMLKGATEMARRVVDHAPVASREILLANLGVEALSAPSTTPMNGSLALQLEAVLEHATHELALGHVSTAHKIAADARIRADEALAGGNRARKLMEEATAVLDGLPTEGPAVSRLREKAASAQEAFSQGFSDVTTMVEGAGLLWNEVAAFADHHTQSRNLLDIAERLHTRLQNDGFCSADVDVALMEARHALDAGDWAGVRENVARALESFIELREGQKVLGHAITEIDQRVSTLQVCRLPLLPAVQEMLARAREELRNCRLSDAGEDLVRANALMMQATRTGS